MTARSSLAQPIALEVDADGRLIRGDDAFLRLNQRAGGAIGERIAIPVFASMARIALQLGMRLSRPARIADDNEHLELWIEVEPRDVVARLSITSWQVLPGAAQSKKAESESKAEDIGLQFDQEFRLTSAQGDIAQHLQAEDFGRHAAMLLPRLFENDAFLAHLIDEAGRDGLAESLRLTAKHSKQVYLATLSVDGLEKRLSLKPVPSAQTLANSQAANPQMMFGKHLAPALRQPLSRIIANAETIGNELQGPIRENYTIYARDIADAARHLFALVDDLGDLEAIERSGFTTARDRIDLVDVARRVAGLLALKAADHRIRIQTPPETETAIAIAEFRRTLQILLNLVNNAIRYSQDGTTIWIESKAYHDYSEISVADEGKGIAEADRERVFDKFERLGRSGDGGSGLGLYISRRLARAMGGELTVGQSAAGGALFTLRLPAR
jgi:signal transduction histidine kinase